MGDEGNATLTLEFNYSRDYPKNCEHRMVFVTNSVSYMTETAEELNTKISIPPMTPNLVPNILQYYA